MNCTQLLCSIKDPGAAGHERTVIVKGINVLGDIQVRGPKKALPWKRNVI